MDIGRGQIKCGLCSKNLKDFKYIAMPEWDISQYLCGSCYSRKLSEYYIKREKKE